MRTLESGQPSYIMAIRNYNGDGIAIRASATIVFIFLYNQQTSKFEMAVFNKDDGQLTNLLQIPQLQENSWLSYSQQSLDVNQYDEAFITITPLYYDGSNQYTKFVVLKIFNESSGYQAKMTMYTQQERLTYQVLQTRKKHLSQRWTDLETIHLMEVQLHLHILRICNYGITRFSSVQSFSSTDASYIIQSQADSLDQNILRSVINIGSDTYVQTFSFLNGIASNKKLAYYTNKYILRAVFTGSTDSDKLYIGGYTQKEFVYSSVNQWNTFSYYQGFIQVQRANGDKDIDNDCTADFTLNNTVSNVQFTNITNLTSQNIYPYISANFYAENESQLAIELVASYYSLNVFDNSIFISQQQACHPSTAITSPNLSSFKVGYYDSTNQTKTFTFVDIYIDSSLCNDTFQDFDIVDNLNLNLSQAILNIQDSISGLNRSVEVTANITDIMNNDTLQINYTLGQQLNFALLDWYFLGGSNVTCQYYTSLSVLPSALTSYASYDSVTQIFQIQATAFSLTSSSPYTLTLRIFNENNTTLTTLTFTISIKGCDVSLIDVQMFSDQQYVIDKNTLNIEITPWLSNCDLIQYSISVNRYDGQTYSAFISMSNDQTAVQIYSSQPQDQGLYRVTVTGTLQNFLPFLSSFDLNVKLQCTLTPTGIQTPQRYKVGTSKNIIYLPFQSEYCQDPITYDSFLVGGNALPDFITFGEGRFSIETNNTFIEKSYQILLIGRIQSENIEKIVRFTINIQFPQVPRVNNITNQSRNSNTTKTPVISSDFYSLSAKVTSISQTGIVSISFNPEFKLLSNDPEKNKKHFSFDISQPDSDEKMDNNQYSFNILEISLGMLFINNGDLAGSSVKILVVGNLFFNLFMSTSLQYLWGMINQIQIITHLPINAVEIPSNTKFFFNIIIDISNFNIIPSDDMLNKMMTVKETDAFNNYFQEMDIFQKTNCTPLFLNSSTLLKYAANIELVEYILLFNYLLRFGSYLAGPQIPFLEMLTLEFEDKSSTISSLASILVLFISLASFVFTLFFLFQNSNQQLKKKDMKAKYGSLYEGVKLYTNSKLPLLQNIIFIFRRITLCSLQIVTGQGYIQTVSNTLLSLFVIAYLIHVRPFKQSFTNKLEIFNEICIMLINYHMLYFLEPNGYSDSDILNSIGYTAIGVTAFSLIANTSITFAISLKLMIKDLIQMYKKKCKKQSKHNQQGQIELSDQNFNESRNQMSSLKYNMTMTLQAELLDSQIQKVKRSKLHKLTMKDKKAKNSKSKLEAPKKAKKNTKKANLKKRKIRKIITEEMGNKQEVINQFLTRFDNIHSQNDLVCQSFSNDNDTTIAQIYRPSISLSDSVITEKPVAQIKNKVQKIKSPKKKSRKYLDLFNSQLKIKKVRDNPQYQEEVKQAKKVNLKENTYYY
eukprot:403367008